MYFRSLPIQHLVESGFFIQLFMVFQVPDNEQNTLKRILQVKHRFTQKRNRYPTETTHSPRRFSYSLNEVEKSCAQSSFIFLFGIKIIYD